MTAPPVAAPADEPEEALDLDDAVEPVEEPEPFEAPAPVFARPHDEDDDEEDEDAHFVPAFSLLQRLRDRDEIPPAPTAVVQAVRAREGRVLEILHLLPGERLPVDGAPGTECRFDAPGRFGVKCGAGARVALRRRGEPDFREHAGTLLEDALHLEPGDAATLRFGARGDEVLLQFVPKTAALPPGSGRLRPDRTLLAFAVATIVFHAGAWGIVGAMGNERIAVATSNDPTAGRFAMIEMKDPLMETPKQKKEPPKKTVVKPKPKPQEKTPVLPPVAPMPQLPESLRKFVNKTTPRTPSGGGNPNLSAKGNQLLSSLNIGPSATAAAATNLNAMTGAAPNSGGFHIGGTIGKLPGDGLKLGAAGAGVGRIDTRSAGEVTQGGKLGRVAGNAGTGAVRGQVKAAPARSVEVQGELDRGEVQKVVNAHMFEVSGCYERRLIKDPTLRGKVVMEWQVMPVGMVGVVKVKFSDLKDPEVASCIQMAIRLWRFPQPKGGSVTITYPFVFSPIGI